MLRTCGVRLQLAFRVHSGPATSAAVCRRSASSHVAPAAAAATSDVPKTAPQPGPHSNIRTHYARQQLPSRQPLLRNFFAGQVDTELLAYPEPIQRDDMAVLDRNVQQFSEYFGSIQAGETLKGQPQIPATILADLRSMGAFGLDVPAAWGGGNCTVTELTRHAEAEAAADCQLAATLNAHRLAVRCLIDWGSPEQQERYLPRLANGELQATVAFHETMTSTANGDNDVFRTHAQNDSLPGQRAAWQLSGEKVCVTNAPQADLFVVFGQVSVGDPCGDRLQVVRAFLVERTAQGVQVLQRDETIGLGAVQQALVRFDAVAAEPLGDLGDEKDGNEIAQRMLRTARFQSVGLALAVQKRLLRQWARFAADRPTAAGGGGEMELLRSRLSRLNCSAYALESMLYWTTGVLDTYEAADVDVESAAMAIFAAEGLREASTVALEFGGVQTVCEGAAMGADVMRDALQVYGGQGESPDALRMFVALSGVKHAGESLHDVVRKVRNPLYNPSFMFRRMFDTQSIEEPKCNLHLNHSLHPSLDPASQWLEQSILRLQAATEIILTRHGAQVLERQCELHRLATCAVQCFASFAAISRASRSYCIGLQHAEYELHTAAAFAFDSQMVAKQLALELRDGPYLTNDMNHQKLAAQVVRSGGYFARHPLLRNF